MFPKTQLTLYELRIAKSEKYPSGNPRNRKCAILFEVLQSRRAIHLRKLSTFRFKYKATYQNIKVHANIKRLPACLTAGCIRKTQPCASAGCVLKNGIDSSIILGKKIPPLHVQRYPNKLTTATFSEPRSHGIPASTPQIKRSGHVSGDARILQRGAPWPKSGRGGDLESRLLHLLRRIFNTFPRKTSN